MTEDTQPLTVRKLTHEQARLEQRLYWSGKTVAERLAGATALTRRMYAMRGIDLDEYKADFTPRRVPHTKPGSPSYDSATQEIRMSAALAKPEPLPIGVIKQFGEYGPEYEVLGMAEPAEGQQRVTIVLVRTGERTTYGYEAMMADPEAM